MLDHKIETFLTLCDTMNYRLAAEKLHITQPAVTQQIHALEEYYQCPLFVYEARRLKKTPYGQELENVSRSMAYQELRLVDALRRPEPRILHIGVTKTIGEVAIAAHLARFFQEPGNAAVITVDNTEELLERLRHGELDFALIEGHFGGGGYGSKRYRTERFSGLCSADHPFAGRTVTVQETLREHLLLREDGSGTRKIFEDLLYEQNCSVEDYSRVTCVNNCGLLRNLLSLGCGISFGYAILGKNDPGIATFSLRDIQVSHDFSYVYLKNSGAEQTVALFDRFSDCAAEQPGEHWAGDLP